jgi:ferredoxin like protein
MEYTGGPREKYAMSDRLPSPRPSSATTVVTTVGAPPLDKQASGMPGESPQRPVPVEEKLYLAKYKLDERPHLLIQDQAVCQKCAQINGSPQPCMILCPADVYKWEDGKRNVVSYDNCVECGACRIICPYANIDWKYPRWGRGLSLRYG